MIFQGFATRSALPRKCFFFFLFLQSPREIIEGIKEKFSQKIFPISEKYWQYRVREENVHLKHHWKINFKLKARGCICQIQLDLSVSIRVTDTLRIFRKDRITRRNNSNRIKKKKKRIYLFEKKTIAVISASHDFLFIPNINFHTKLLCLTFFVRSKPSSRRIESPPKAIRPFCSI